MLRRLFDEAKSAENKSRSEPPDYTEQVNNLMKHIADSPWRDGKYPAGQMNEIFNRIDNSSLLDIRSMLTAIMRSKRFSTGAWQNAFDSGRLEKVIERAETICAS